MVKCRIDIRAEMIRSGKGICREAMTIAKVQDAKSVNSLNVRDIELFNGNNSFVKIEKSEILS